MRVLIAGGSGMIGQKMQSMWRKQGLDVFILSRKKSDNSQIIQWSVKDGWIDTEMKFDAVVNLAGAGIVDKSWSQAYKRSIVESRVATTALLDQHMIQQGWAPKVFLNASAVGIYGDHPTKIFEETDKAIKSDFMVITCEAWEEAVHEMQTIADHHYIVRIGVVLSNKGGAFPRLSMGRPVGIVPHLGDGHQYMSWIHINDLVGVFSHLLMNQPASGTYNAVAPNPETNRHFSKLVASTGLLGVSPPVPELIIGTLLGERKIAVLNSTRASARKILESGYSFEFTQAHEAIGELVKSSRSRTRLY